MPSISARAASSSTTRTRPREGPFWAAVGGTTTILRCSGRETATPARSAPDGCPPCPDRVAAPAPYQIPPPRSRGREDDGSAAGSRRELADGLERPSSRARPEPGEELERPRCRVPPRAR